MTRMTSIAVALTVALGSQAAVAQCPPDAVRVGSLCVDRYEASVWKVPATLPNAATLVAAIQAGMITSETQLDGALRRGAAGDDYGNCTDDGGGACTKNYAVSIPGVIPSASITWFQALAACTSSHKRLLTNQEWTAAALGSPDPGGDNGTTDCNTDSAQAAVNTGSRSACVSSRGAFDMVGNLFEWVGDWVPLSTGCVGWDTFSDDAMCVSGASTTAGPGALIRGGVFDSEFTAGPLTVNSLFPPSFQPTWIGFRCAREL